MRLRNLTPHPIHLTVGHQTHTIHPETPTPRITESLTATTTIHHDGSEIPLVALALGAATDLPTSESDTLLVVPRAIAILNPHRSDLVVPYDHTRDLHGNVTGCRGVARLTSKTP